MTFGGLLKRKRSQQGLPAQAYANALNLTKSFIYQVENGEKGPLSTYQVYKLAKSFDWRDGFVETILMARGESLSRFEIPYIGDGSDRLALFLSQKWMSLTDGHLKQIADIVGMPDK